MIDGFEPLFDRILIKPDEVSIVSKSGIILSAPSGAHTSDKDIVLSEDKGTVMAVGKDVKSIIIGKKALFNSYVKIEKIFNDKLYYIIKEGDILGILNQ